MASQSTENTQKNQRNNKRDSAMDQYKGNYMAGPIELTPDKGWQLNRSR